MLLCSDLSDRYFTADGDAFVLSDEGLTVAPKVHDSPKMAE